VREEQIEQVNAVLAEIGARHIPQILVYNKIDQRGLAAGFERDDCGNIARVWLSAQTGEGLGGLRLALGEAATRRKEVPTEAVC
jgi:GTP-binding protein HflX